MKELSWVGDLVPEGQVAIVIQPGEEHHVIWRHQGEAARGVVAASPRDVSELPTREGTTGDLDTPFL